MTFPNTPISTQHLDTDTDSVASARADIQSAVSTVNSVIDEFEIGEAQENQVIQYDGTKWQPAFAGGGAVNWTMVTNCLGNPSINTSLFPNSNISIVNNKITLATGDYMLIVRGGIYRLDAVPSYSVSDGTTTLFNQSGSSIGNASTRYRWLRVGHTVFYTATSTATLTTTISGSDAGTLMRIVPLG